MQINHVVLPSLNQYIHFEVLNYLREIKIEDWNLALCALDYYAKGNDSMYQAYWASYAIALDIELEQPENHALALKLKTNLPVIQEYVGKVYLQIRETICNVLSSHSIPPSTFNKVSGISSEYNYIRIEVINESLQ